MTSASGLQGATIDALCHLGRVSRAGYYRWLVEAAPAQTDIALRHCIQLLALANKHYGYRRITVELRRQGYVVNTKRVLRLMREDNLLVLRRKSFVPQTTDSGHVFPIAPNLIRELVPTGLDQIWVADITYVRLQQAFIYLAVVLNAFSRKVVGWALEDHLRAELAIAALDMALAARKPRPNSLIHHSDRGIQYASVDYVRRLRTFAIHPSMSAPGNPYHNAKAESFMKTLKQEQINAATYTTLEHARSEIGIFIEEIYNRKRLHSSIGYRPPDEFEQTLTRSSDLVKIHPQNPVTQI